METKEVDISQFWENGEGPVKVKIKKLELGEVLDIEDACTEIQMNGKRAIPVPKMGRMKLLILLKGIVDAPFKIDEPTIKGLDSNLGIFIAEEIDDFNKIDIKK